MVSLARKVIVCAAADGLILQPLQSRREQRTHPAVKIRYGDASISPAPGDHSASISKPMSSFEAFGIVGLISVARFSYLISITRRQQVAQIRGYPVYVVTEVALTPCSSYQDASVAVAQTATALQTQSTEPNSDDDDDGTGSTTSDDEVERTAGSSTRGAGDDNNNNNSDDDDLPDPDPLPEEQKTAAPSSSVAQDVIGRKGSYGRFARRWFSRTGWAMEQKRLMGLSDSTPPEQQQRRASTSASKKAAAPEKAADVAEAAASGGSAIEEDRATPAAGGLLPKLLRTTQILFGSSRSFFFSYEYDITRSLANSSRAAPSSSPVPLHRQVDPMYFWNRHILQPFVDAGVDSLALPLMQGFVGQRSFVVDSQPPQVDDDAKDSVELSNFRRPSGDDESATGSRPSPPPPPPLRDGKSVGAGGGSDNHHHDNGDGLRPTQKRFDITVISRRSVKRAGLRYLRRGVDDEGFVANAVETEQLLSPSHPAGPGDQVFSFVQVRGSIPLFFTQSPYSLRPAPVLRHSPEANYLALTRHFERLERQYGSLQVVNLVEKHGIEAPLGAAFEANVRKLNEEAREKAKAAAATDTATAGGPGDKEGRAAAAAGGGGEEEEGDKSDASGNEDRVPFEWFDFHAVCRGMKFENVSLLVEALATRLAAFGSTAATATDWRVTGRQAGVLRTNCLDCLDRTNVCQSAFARNALDGQLRGLGFDAAAQVDQEAAWFNTLWADNGDAISKQYASTAAMKGDYTRTKKRNYRGALLDAGLSLTRFFNGMVNDFFLQATIDFLLGNVTAAVFDEFEATMMTQDPAVSMQKMREQAIELSQKRVVADDSEDLVGGWTMLTPRNPDAAVRGGALATAGGALEEAVLLLTDAALYLCRFDWDLDKVRSFERVELAHVQKVRVGTYVTSTLSPAQADETRNVGLVVEYAPGRNDITRTNTRALSSIPGGGDSSNPSAKRGEEGKKEGNAQASSSSGLASLLSRRTSQQQQRQQQPPPSRKIALKAPYTTTYLADPVEHESPDGSDLIVGGGGNRSNNIGGLGAGSGGNGSGTGTRPTELQLVETVAAEIERLALRAQPWRFDGGKKPGEVTLIERGDIVSLAEARRSTGLLEQLGHSIKKMVWA